MNSEPIINAALADALRGTHPAWREGIDVEQSRVLADRGRRPDLLVAHPGGQTVEGSPDARESRSLVFPSSLPSIAGR